MRVIVVDNSAVMRRVIAHHLRTMARDLDVPLEVVGFGTAKEALDAFATDGADLILSDWVLTGMSGHRFLQEVRNLSSNVPFGFITVEATTAHRDESIASGALFMLPKPFTTRTLTDTLFDVLSPP